MRAGSNAGLAGMTGVGSVNSTISANSAEAIEALKSDMLMVYKAVIALEKRVNEYTVNMVEIKPQLIALKVHSESFPNAMREMRRGQTAIQESVTGLERRLLNLEARLKVRHRFAHAVHVGQERSEVRNSLNIFWIERCCQKKLSERLLAPAAGDFRGGDIVGELARRCFQQRLSKQLDGGFELTARIQA